MNSFRISDHCENNVSNINISQCSGDLFQESPQLECKIHSSFTSDTKFSNEKSSETSDELCFTPRRKPRRALSLSNDSSLYYSKKSSDSLPNDSNTDSSKFFQPISPACKINKIGSTSLLEVDQSGSPEGYKTPGIHHLSKENVAVISFVSESAHSDTSSILDGSLKSEEDFQNSKQFFKTPICSSVKKRTIRQWLNSVSLNCSLKPSENGLYDRHEVPPESNLLKDKHDSKLINVNVCTPSSVEKNHDHDKTYDGKELEGLNILVTSNLSNDNIEKSDTSELFNVLENKINECSMKQDESCHIRWSPKQSNVVNGHYTLNQNQKSPDKSTSFRPHYKLSNPLETSFHEDSERNISKKGKIFNKHSRIYKSDDNFSSQDSDSTFNEISKNSPSKIVDSDDSFTKIRLIRKKKKKNCLNISSDDSEAKDTANESEDIPNHNNDLCTPRRRLYFRNPLNNSLDDDAKPLSIGKGYSISSKDNCIEKGTVKSKNLLDQIYSKIHHINSLEALDDSKDKCSADGNGVGSDLTSLNGSCLLGKSVSTQASKELDEINGSISHYKSSSIRNLSLEEQDDDNQINFSGISIGNTSQNNISENNFGVQKNTSNKDGFKSCSALIDEFQSNEILDSSNRLDDSSDSIVNIERKSKKNVLNFSSDDNSFLSEKPNHNIIDVNEIFDNEPTPSETKPSIDLTKSDDEYDKYMYRTRSDSSFSDDEEIPGVSKDSSEVISVHTTTSEEAGDDGKDPWFDLESYLKKNIPASSKSFDSSFIKNSEKRNARLAKISLPTHSSCPNHTSFLLSLTPGVPDEMCHPEAIKYRGESFSKHKNELVDLLFKLFNQEIFDEKLPPLEIKWSGHLTTTSGITKSSSKITKNGKFRNSIIKLSKTVVNEASKVRDVLLHELCHAANWLIDEQAGGHGPLFKKWVNKIWMKYPDVPKVRTTHHYELKWKYLYKCSYCGYELGKMKLSLNENSCRLCGGLVTVNT